MNDTPFNPAPPAYTEGFMELDYERVLESLQEAPPQASLVFGEENTTLLHAAAFDGQLAIVKKLISLGADVNVKDTGGVTPLHLAANQGYIEIIEVLVENGADLEARDINGSTPLRWGKACRAGSPEHHAEVVKKLLSLGAKDDG